MGLTTACDRSAAKGENVNVAAAAKPADHPTQSSAPADGEPKAASPSAASAAGDQPAPSVSLSGSRTDRIAGIFRNIVAAGEAPDWETALAAFPGARWGKRETHAPLWGDNSTLTQTGSIDLSGAIYGIDISGVAGRVNRFHLSSPGDDTIEWSTIEPSLRTLGVKSRNIGCHSPTGFGYVRLTSDRGSAVLHKSVNYGSAVPSTDEYEFSLRKPFGDQTEAQAASDRSLCN
ncbi:hypothetical protein U8326_03875 [Tsuneonella sp. CC-YZS046]|uniref:hypothetical protein n=1 Tax=Tsuneonella sp. CC-YZS046 TaxID=3042152 RepID=UPI002D786A01|nr:hypothetical protein [Tsuneonella sp. CC-YZS046]WRO67317.1 hypothetical protein U8326_03875 [Tsuneonella sp. CC-YZS046]